MTVTAEATVERADRTDIACPGACGETIPDAPPYLCVMCNDRHTGVTARVTRRLDPYAHPGQFFH